MRTADAKLRAAFQRQKIANNPILAQTEFEELKEAATYLGMNAKQRLLNAGPRPLLSIVSRWHRQTHGVGDHEARALAVKVGKSYFSMQELDLSQETLETLPGCIGQLNRLQIFNLSCTVLAKLPDSFARLTGLIKLDISKGMLREVPSAVFKLFRLQELDLHANLLTEIPPEIGALHALTSLSMSHNRLNRLPESFSRLTSLRILGLSNNQFTTLPTVVRRLEYLQNIYFDGNRMPRVVQEVGDGCEQKVLACLVDDGARFLQIGFSIAHVRKVAQRKNGAEGLTAFRNLHGNLLAMRFTHNEIVRVASRTNGAVALTCLEKHA
ncbi:MAG: leucine-rich repeat domain-containing protein, partial [Cytophagaceae bacterium]